MLRRATGLSSSGASSGSSKLRLKALFVLKQPFRIAALSLLNSIEPDVLA